MKASNIKPQFFPLGDNSWRQIFNCDKESTNHYLYTNEDGRILFVVVVQNTVTPQGKKNKRVFQGSYNNGTYIRENIWTKVEGFKKPLYKAHLLKKTKDPILLAEGEKCAVTGEKLFPNHFVTAYQGRRS